MRIVCPACEAAYEVPVDRMTAGRIVRCARCATDWVPMRRPEPQPAPVEPPPAIWPEPPSAATLDEPPPPPATDPAERDAPARNAGWALGLAWVLSVSAVLACLTGAVIARERVMTVWPPSTRAYLALGLK